MMTAPAFVRLLLVVTFLLEIYGEFIHSPELVFFTKPLVLPLIGLYFFMSIKGRMVSVHLFMLTAFLFSWFGDIFLMLTPETVADTQIMGIIKNKNFFVLGLGSFLVAQLLFISSYRKAKDRPLQGTAAVRWFHYLPFVVLWAGMMAIVLPSLQTNLEKQPATIPVIIYSAILLTMAATALSRFGRTNSSSFRNAFIGACIFVVSDGLIAINFLVLPEPTYYAGFTIFITYAVAEYLIAQGILKHDMRS
ncbi:MAG: lysoplasmalogenase [Flavobacteriales bacterium]|nr:lysoplasmalogenase [Flavobacteriales bacterium]